MDYLNWLQSTLTASAIACGYTSFVIKCWNERDIEQNEGLLVVTENTINVVLKALPNTISYYVQSNPYEITVISEANDIKGTQEILSYFTSTYNYYFQQLSEKNSDNVTQLNTYKHAYSSAVLVDPYMQQGVTVRGIFLINANITVINNVADIYSSDGVLGSITVNGVDYKLTSFSFAYVMNPNVSVAGNVSDLSTTIAQNGSFSLSIGTPCVSSSLVTSAITQALGGLSSNTAYNVAFSVGGISFNNIMRLASVSFTSSPDDAPVLALGFTV